MQSWQVFYWIMLMILASFCCDSVENNNEEALDPIFCYQCTIFGGNCNSGQCKGSFCEKLVEQSTHYTKTTKRCLSSAEPMLAQTLNNCTVEASFDISRIRCVCNSSKFCNSSNRHSCANIIFYSLVAFVMHFAYMLQLQYNLLA